MTNPLTICLMRKPGDPEDFVWMAPDGTSVSVGIAASDRPGSLGSPSVVGDYPTVALPINPYPWRVITTNPAPGLLNGGTTGYTVANGALTNAFFTTVGDHNLGFTEDTFEDLWWLSPYYSAAYYEMPTLTATGVNADIMCATSPEVTGYHAFAAFIYNDSAQARTCKPIYGGVLQTPWVYTLAPQSWTRIAGYINIAALTASTFGFRITNAANGEQFVLAQCILAARPSGVSNGTPSFGVPFLFYDQANGTWPKLTWTGATNNSRSTMAACAPSPITWAQSGLSASAGAMAMRFFPTHPGNSADLTTGIRSLLYANNYCLLAGDIDGWSILMQAMTGYIVDISNNPCPTLFFEMFDTADQVADNFLSQPFDDPFGDAYEVTQAEVAAMQVYTMDWTPTRMHAKLGDNDSTIQRRNAITDETVYAANSVYLASAPSSWGGNGAAYGLFGYALFSRPLTDGETAYLEAENAIWHPRMFAQPERATVSAPSAWFRGDSIEATITFVDEHGDAMLLPGKTVWFTLRDLNADNAATDTSDAEASVTAYIVIDPDGTVSSSSQLSVHADGLYGGKLTLTLAESDSLSLSAGENWYDVQVLAQGVVRTLARGMIDVRRDVTRRIVTP